MTRIAAAAPLPYLVGMTAPRLLRLLTMLALLLMPLGMIPGSHAMAAAHAAPAAAASEHCAEAPGHGRPGPAVPADRSADCALACSALPSIAAFIPMPELAPVMLHKLRLDGGRGLTPEAATPPPRRS